MSLVDLSAAEFSAERVRVVVRNTRSGAYQEFPEASVEVLPDQHTGVFAIRLVTKDYPNGVTYQLSIDRWSVDVTPLPSGGGGCVLTTACVRALGADDDCHELQMFRAMRDNYLRRVPGGQARIDDYYRTAPIVIAAVEISPDPRSAWREIYSDLVAPAVHLVDEGQADAAAELALLRYEEVKAQYGVH